MSYLTIVGPDGFDKCSAPLDCHGYCKEQLNSMASAGYKFKVDNKLVSLSKILQQSNNKVSQPCDNYQPAVPITNKEASKDKTVMIRCIETGDMFDKQSEAAKFFKIDPAAVSDSLKTGRKRAGYTFDRVEV